MDWNTIILALIGTAIPACTGIIIARINRAAEAAKTAAAGVSDVAKDAAKVVRVEAQRLEKKVDGIAVELDGKFTKWIEEARAAAFAAGELAEKIRREREGV